MKKRVFVISGIVLALIALGIFNRAFSKKDSGNTFAEVREGLFEITVANSGELIAEKSIDIFGPDYYAAQQQEQRNEQQQQEQRQQQQQQRQQQQQQGSQQRSVQGGSQGSGQGSGQSSGQSGRTGSGGSGGGGGGGGGGGSMGGGGQQRGGDFHMTDFKIQDIVPEGTIVKAGDYVAQLDRTNYENSLKDAQESFKTMQASLEMRILDTAVTVTNLRDDIKNQRYAVEEARIALDQSIYEPPATIRKAESNLDKQQRSLEQRIKSCELKTIQAGANIKNQQIALQGQERLVKNLENFLAQFTVKAPSDGMIIYKKDRLGNKRKAGSNVNAFDRVIATLPDLTSMISKVYVNEIEVSKVYKGQRATITIDAFPEKVYAGTIIYVANIGETLPNSDAKMFEVHIKIDGSDMNLRPAMTSWNKIILKTFDNALYIPLECVRAGTDSIPYVYKKNKTKQIVILGEQNDKFVIVKQGLEPGQSIYTIMPEEPEKFRLTGEDLIAVAKENK